MADFLYCYKLLATLEYNLENGTLLNSKKFLLWNYYRLHYLRFLGFSTVGISLPVQNQIGTKVEQKSEIIAELTANQLPTNMKPLIFAAVVFGCRGNFESERC